MTRRRLLRIIVPLLVALIATLIVAKLSAQPGGRTAPVLVAKSAVPAGSVLSAQDLQVDEVPAAAALPGSLPSAAQAVGEVTRVALTAGGPVLGDELMPAQAAGLAYAIPPGHRAMTIAVNGVSGVAGNLAPGAQIDVLATFSYQSGTGAVPGTPRSTVVVQDVVVLSVGQAGAAASGQTYTLVTLSVTPTQAAKISLTQQEGTIVLLLRPPTGAGPSAASVSNGGLAP